VVRSPAVLMVNTPGDRTTCGGNPDGHPHHAPDALGVGGSALLVLQEPIGRLLGRLRLAEHTDKSAGHHPRVSESHDMAFIRLVRAREGNGVDQGASRVGSRHCRSSPLPSHALHRWPRISETLVAAHGNPPRFTNRSQEPLRAVVDPPIVIKKHRSSLPRNTVNFTQAPAAFLHHWSSRAALWGTSRHADRLGTAAMGRNTCANQRPHLLLQSSAF
jgi:hypothetical protein